MTNEICEEIKPEIEHIVRQAHMNDGEGYDASNYCVGCVERAIEETCKKFIPCKDCMVLHSPENCPQNEIKHLQSKYAIDEYFSKEEAQNHSPQDVKIGTAKTGLPEDTEPEEVNGSGKGSMEGIEDSGFGDSLSIFEYEDKDLDMKFYPKDKVKEAVKKLKEALPYGLIIEEIDKIFGGALV